MLADFVDAVVCLDLETNTLASKLPGYTKATMDSMGINFGETCVMVYSNNRMIEVNLKTGRYKQSPRTSAQGCQEVCSPGEN